MLSQDRHSVTSWHLTYQPITSLGQLLKVIKLPIAVNASIAQSSMRVTGVATGCVNVSKLRYELSSSVSRGSVAQWLESLAHNQISVPGSTPGPGVPY